MGSVAGRAGGERQQTRDFGHMGRVGTSRTITLSGDRSCRAYDALRQPHMPENFGRGYPEPNLPRHMPENFGRKVTFILLPLPAGQHPLIWPAGKPSADLDPRSRHTRQAYRKRKRGNALDRRESRRARCAGRNRCAPPNRVTQRVVVLPCVAVRELKPDWTFVGTVSTGRQSCDRDRVVSRHRHCACTPLTSGGRVDHGKLIHLSVGRQT